jgi:hypothetical protein
MLSVYMLPSMVFGNEYHPEQIPTEYNEEQTLRAIRKQSKVPGERKEKTINDFPKAAAIGQILKDLNFPADKPLSTVYIKSKAHHFETSSQSP